jgi:tetratricopeptide (TPR) repeat protein
VRDSSESHGVDNSLFVGVTGRQSIADPQAVLLAVDAVLKRIAEVFPARGIVLVTSLADGADGLVSKHILDSVEGARLIANLPMPREDYERGLATDSARREFAQLHARAVGSIALKHRGSPKDASEEIAMFIVSGIEILIAVWDGKPARSPGDTADLVRLARGKGLPLAWIVASRAEPDAGMSVPEGTVPGNVLFERFEPNPRPRSVRVFVSSTFLDMRRERDALVNDVFPRLKLVCEKRGVTFTGIDLRWGITEEQVHQGDLLPLLFQQIRACRPYFLCMLGDRYGSCPPPIPPRVLELHPWLRKMERRSLTEIEIQYAVLRRRKMAKRALFYFRKPDASNAIGPQPMPAVTERDQRRLERLDSAIKRAGAPQRSYVDIAEFSDAAYKDLLALIDADFPGQEMDPLDRDTLEQKVFEYKLGRVVEGRTRELAFISESISASTAPIIVIGESGSGKSALLARWTARQLKREGLGGRAVVSHYIESTRDSGDLVQILKRLLHEFWKIGCPRPKPDATPADLKRHFAMALHHMGRTRGLVLVIDGLDHLEDKDAARTLHWIPREMPEGVHLILSSTAGDICSRVEEQGWVAYPIGRLRAGSLRRIVYRYPKTLYGKEIPEALRERIVRKARSTSPRFLRVLLEEMRVHGDHETLAGRLQPYLEASDEADLYDLVLSRLAGEIGPNGNSVIRKLLVPMWASRRGLSETELLECSGGTRIDWIRVLLGLQESLIQRSGFHALANEYLREAIRRKFLPTKAHESCARAELVRWLAEHATIERRSDEIPWLLAKDNDWKSLLSVLSDPDLFGALWSRDPFEAQSLWHHVEATGTGNRLDAYRWIIESPLDHPTNLHCVGAVLHAGGFYELEFRIHAAEEKLRSSAGSPEGARRSKLDQALDLYILGKWDEALASYEDLQLSCREVGDRQLLQMVLLNQSVILHKRGQMDQALSLLEEQAAICREIHEYDDLERSLHNQALVWLDRGDTEPAAKLLDEAMDLCIENGDKYGEAHILGTRAVLTEALKDIDRARDMFLAERKILLEIGDTRALPICLINLARIEPDAKEAVALAGQALEVAESHGDLRVLQVVFTGFAGICLRDQRFKDALRHAERGVGLSRKLGNVDDLCRALISQGVVFEAGGRWRQAIDAFAEAAQLARSMGKHREHIRALEKQSALLMDHGTSPERVAVAQEISQFIENKRSGWTTSS